MRRTRRWAVPALALAAGCGGDREEGGGAEADPGAAPAAGTAPASGGARPACAPDNGGITLPAGFCAVVAADEVGRPRHVAVAPNGDVYVALQGRRSSGGGVLALRDTDGDGRADVRETFYDRGGTGIAVHQGWLYFAPDDGVVRWRMEPGRLVPAGQPQTVVSGLPVGGHSAKSIAFDARGGLLVNLGSESNSCQREDRQAESPGQEPCGELNSRAGIWRFAADRQGQAASAGERWATGVRNGLALAVNPADGTPYAVSHGRDQLSGNWPRLFTDAQNAEKPAEEMMRLERGADFGWPYCYFDPELRARVLAPEYGGDGRRAGRCAGKADPVAFFPAHWAPNALLFYTGTQFPEKYRGGAFVAFHGSWNRAPLPQAGYRVSFVPFNGAGPAGRYEDFASGFGGPDFASGDAAHRPTGLAQGPDGSLYVTDDAGGRIWKIVYTGGTAGNGG
ncbi:MAG TPA: PQQ-dependent sugar dehydrogenase [Longimicrobiaceae bacterium]|nr:PQQ-dependent sugar dehydrogenase [Longimicrobiaceae bacterium]